MEVDFISTIVILMLFTSILLPFLLLHILYFVETNLWSVIIIVNLRQPHQRSCKCSSTWLRAGTTSIWDAVRPNIGDYTNLGSRPCPTNFASSFTLSLYFSFSSFTSVHMLKCVNRAEWTKGWLCVTSERLSYSVCSSPFTLFIDMTSHASNIFCPNR